MLKRICGLILVAVVAACDPGGNGNGEPDLGYTPYTPPDILLDPSGGGNCVTPDTMILLPDAPGFPQPGASKRAGDIQIGDYVLAKQAHVNGSSLTMYEAKKVLDVFTYESNTMVKVVFQGSETQPAPEPLIATAKHRVMTGSDGTTFVEVGALTPGTGLWGVGSWEPPYHPVAIVDHIEAYADGPAVLIQIEGSEWVGGQGGFGYFTNGLVSYDPPEAPTP